VLSRLVSRCGSSRRVGVALLGGERAALGAQRAEQVIEVGAEADEAEAL
jgi:hypothetical protein